MARPRVSGERLLSVSLLDAFTVPCVLPPRAASSRVKLARASYAAAPSALPAAPDARVRRPPPRAAVLAAEAQTGGAPADARGGGARGSTRGGAHRADARRRSRAGTWARRRPTSRRRRPRCSSGRRAPPRGPAPRPRAPRPTKLRRLDGLHRGRGLMRAADRDDDERPASRTSIPCSSASGCWARDRRPGRAARRAARVAECRHLQRTVGRHRRRRWPHGRRRRRPLRAAAAGAGHQLAAAANARVVAARAPRG